MASTIIHKRSSVASKVPVAGDLIPGELAINTADGKLFMKKDDASIVEIGSGLTHLFVQFNGATGVVNGSSGIASVVKNGTGDYTINFSSALPDTAYAVSGLINNAASSNTSVVTRATTSVQLRVYNSAAALFDSNDISVIIVR